MDQGLICVTLCMQIFTATIAILLIQALYRIKHAIDSIQALANKSDQYSAWNAEIWNSREHLRQLMHPLAHSDHYQDTEGAGRYQLIFENNRYQFQLM